MNPIPTGSRRRRSLWRPAAALAALGLLAACSGPSTPSTPSQPSEPGTPSTPSEPAPPGDDGREGVDGGTASFALDNTVTCADPQQSTAFAGLTVSQHTVDQLTYQNPETAAVEPWLATRWEANDDASAFTFFLRDDVTFADGSPLTAELVKRNFEEIVALGAAAPLGSSYLSGIESITVDAPDAVTVTFGHPNAQFLQATSTTSLAILAEASFDATPEQRCDGDYIGSGPYTLTDFTRDQSLTIAKREGYDWAPEAAGHTGDAYLDEIEFRIVPEAGVRTGLLSSGQLDAIAGLFREDEAQFFDNPDYWVLARATPGLANTFIANSRTPALNDPDVRQAIQIGIDRQQINDTAVTSLGQPATNLLSSTAPYGADRSAELTRDADAANALLDAAGWERGADGVRAKDGERLSFKLVHFAAQVPIVELVNQQLHAIGIELVSEVLNPAERLAVEAAADFDLIQRNLTRADPDVLRNQFSFHYSNYLYRDAPDELDDLLELQAATVEEAARQTVIDQIQDILIGENWAFPVNELTQVYAGVSEVQGVILDSASRPSFYGAWRES